MKSILFAAMSVLVFGCSTLSQKEVAHVSTAGAGDQPGALVSGPAILHLNSLGRGQVTVYLVDDSGVAGDSCPTAAADAAQTIRVLVDETHVSDLPIPGGKRACSVFQPGAVMSLSWLAELFPKPASSSGSTGELVANRAVEGVVLARR